MLKVVVLLIQAVIASTLKASSLNYRPGGKKMLIYGFYQSCSEENPSLASNLTQDADECRIGVKLINSKKMEINCELL